MQRRRLIDCLLVGLIGLAGACARAQDPFQGEVIPTPPTEAHANHPPVRQGAPPVRTVDEEYCADCYGGEPWGNGGGEWIGESLARFHEFSSRSSQTHGRSTGMGKPLRGTSWLNRPYEVSFDAGALLMAGKPAIGVRSANDRFFALRAGWDWDHYWGTQASIGWSTPDLNGQANGTSESDNLFITDVSLMYYPWGDSRVRPYWRMGMGLTDIEFTNINGVRQQEFLFTIPFGIGIKHQFRRWLVWKAEIVDNLALGFNEANTVNNITISLGMEARFGGRPGGYWAWRPRGYGW